MLGVSAERGRTQGRKGTQGTVRTSQWVVPEARGQELQEEKEPASTHAEGSGPEVSARRAQGAWEGRRTGGAAPLPPAQPRPRALRAFRPSLTSPLPGEGLPCIQDCPPAHSQALTSGGALGSPGGLAGTAQGKLTHRHRLNSLGHPNMI